MSLEQLHTNADNHDMSRLSATICKPSGVATGAGNSAFDQSILFYGNSPVAKHIAKLRCGKPTKGRGSAPPTAADLMHASQLIGLKLRPRVEHKPCVLPPGHNGRCTADLKEHFSVSPQLLAKLVTSCYETPGADGCVFKNRARRDFEIALTTQQQRSIRDPQAQKKKCAIPLKEYAPVSMAADCYLDWAVFLRNTKGVEVNAADPNFEATEHMLQTHKDFIIAHYAALDPPRQIFDASGNTMCVVSHRIVTLEDWHVDRENVQDSDVQLGHIMPRSDEYCSIKSLNTVVMTRRANLIMGEHCMTDNACFEEISGFGLFRGAASDEIARLRRLNAEKDARIENLLLPLHRSVPPAAESRKSA